MELGLLWSDEYVQGDHWVTPCYFARIWVVAGVAVDIPAVESAGSNSNPPRADAGRQDARLG